VIRYLASKMIPDDSHEGKKIILWQDAKSKYDIEL
jgi:hypothetical protein